MILLIDNYDSFVHNLARNLQRLGQETVVVRNDEITAGENPGAWRIWRENNHFWHLYPAFVASFLCQT